MSSSFYDIGRLLLVGEDQIEEVEERYQDGDLADMVRSSFNGRRGGLLYPQDHQSDIPASTIYSNHHHIWSLTCTKDHEQPQQQQDEISCVDQRGISGSSGQCLLDENIDVEYLHQAAAGGDPFSTSIMMTNTTTTSDHPAPHQHHQNNHNNMMFHPSSGIAPLEHLPTSSRSSMMHHMMIKSRAEAGGGLINECVRVKPPINCNVFSQMLHISSSTNDLLAHPLPPLIVDQNKQQPQQTVAPPSSSSSSFTELIGIGSNSKDIDHITTNNNIIRTSSNGRGIKTMLLNDDHSNRNCTITSATCFDTLLHRNPAIKRSRKSLAKKVVCIPAPSPATSRPSGEVVPSDLWAWRKYGQKPIKGSPYPRGYYRCSSSKGCLARKQVERSRTDPNMLVITYTSEHNHPWPTQRNALAGSTRSHPSKNTSNSSSPWTGAVVIDDQINLTSSTKDHELKPAEMVIKQQKVDEHLGASVHDYSNDQRENSSRDYEEGERWRCSYNKMTYRPRTLDQLEEYNEQSQDDDFFAELGEIAGKDHNGFSSFLMDWPSSERIHDQDKAVI